MKLLEEFNKVKAENKKCIVFVKSGVFYISLGIDAYILNHILKLKLTDMSNTKRVGIPINSIEKYIDLMQNYDIPYVIVNNGKIVYKCNGKFDFVLKTPKFESLIGLLNMKDKILEYILKILSKNLGEVI
ncbi:MAG: hypothetical protein ACLTON_05335 [Christensenellales bacterium]